MTMLSSGGASGSAALPERENGALTREIEERPRGCGSTDASSASRRVVRAPLAPRFSWAGAQAFSSVDVEGYPERRAKPVARCRVQLTSKPAGHTLGDREEVVANHYTVARKPVLDAKWHLGREATNRARYSGDGDVGENWYRPIASQNYDGASAVW